MTCLETSRAHDHAYWLIRDLVVQRSSFIYFVLSKSSHVFIRFIDNKRSMVYGKRKLKEFYGCGKAPALT